jgi:hypothetical protein
LSSPKTFNEKIQYLKLYNKCDLHTICADKFAVRKYVSKTIGSEHLIPLLFSTKDATDITDENIPATPFIIKANHTSGTYKIVTHKKQIDINELRELSKSWLHSDHYQNTKEWQYKYIPRKIIIEKLLQDENGTIPSDYKFACFNGKVKIIHIDSNKEHKHLRNHYDADWNPLDFKWPAEYAANSTIPKPKSLDKMISLAEALAKPFQFVRVDFYLLEDKIYFGELTFHPTSGFGKFAPEKYDLFYGNLLNLESLK